MFTERLNQIFMTLHTTNQEIAAAAGCDRSNISRLRSGSRVPKPTGVASEHLAQGLYSWAKEHEALPMLLRLMGESKDLEEEKIPVRILTWLFADMDFPVRRHHKEFSEEAKHIGFGRRLSQCMDLCGLSSIRLSQITGVDASQISRFRNGARKPKHSSRALLGISAALLQRFSQENRMPQLAELTGLDPESLTLTEGGARVLRDWLLTEPEE